jgi:hypothetical protein
MKKILSLSIILLLAVSAAQAQLRNTNDLLGIWTGPQIRVEFTGSSTVSVVFAGNKKQTGTYTADFLLTPATLEMSFTDGNKPLEFKCLVELVDKDTLKWEVFSKAGNPRYFGRGVSMLKRAKN